MSSLYFSSYSLSSSSISFIFASFSYSSLFFVSVSSSFLFSMSISLFSAPSSLFYPIPFYCTPFPFLLSSLVSSPLFCFSVSSPVFLYPSPLSSPAFLFFPLSGPSSSLPLLSPLLPFLSLQFHLFPHLFLLRNREFLTCHNFRHIHIYH